MRKVVDVTAARDAAVRAGEARRILLVVFAALVAQQVLLNLAALLVQRDINYVRAQDIFGGDFGGCMRASRDFLTGVSPYACGDFYMPPLSCLVAIPFLPFGWPPGSYAFLVAYLAMVLIALALTARCFSLRSATEVALLAGIFGLYCPSYWLLQRGNIDGIAMLCAALAIWAVGRAWASAFVVLGASLKIYPAVLLVYFVMARRWRALGIAALTALISVAAVWPLWPAYGHAIMKRSTMVDVEFNVSLFNASGLMGIVRSPQGRIALTAAAAVGFLGLQALADLRAHAQSAPAEAARLALYIPFFAAAPLIVFPYTQVSFLLLVPVFWWMSRAGVLSRFAEICFVIGFLLTAMHERVWTDLTGIAVLHLLPATGTLLLLTACTAAKRQWALRSEVSAGVRPRLAAEAMLAGLTAGR